MLQLIFNYFFLVIFARGLLGEGTSYTSAPWFPRLTGAGAFQGFGEQGPGHPPHRLVLTACRKSVSSFLRFLHLAAASLFRSRLTRRRSSSSGLICSQGRRRTPGGGPRARMTPGRGDCTGWLYWG